MVIQKGTSVMEVLWVFITRQKHSSAKKPFFSFFTFQSECLSFTYLFTLLKSKTYGSLKARGKQGSLEDLWINALR